MKKQEFFHKLQYLIRNNSTDIIAEDFKYDILRVWENKVSDIFRDHVQMVNKPARISGFLIDSVYIKKRRWKNSSLMQLLKIVQIMML